MSYKPGWVELGLKHLKCPNCGNELSIILGVFGNNYKIARELNIKYECTCICEDNEYFRCYRCGKAYTKDLEEI